jgi:DNA-3-methyladenine glycosylase II
MDFAMFIEPRQPFSFAHTLRFVLSPPALLNGRKFEPILDHLVEGEYRRVVSLHGQPVLYGVKEEKRGAKCGLAVRILAGEADEEEIRRLVEKQFSASLDLLPFYRLAKSDNVLGRLVERFRGMRVPQAPTVYETIVSAILEQQVNLSFAHQVKKALVETFGSHVEFEGTKYNAFPEPAALSIATPRQLRRIQISGPKARYIIAISCATLDGSLDLEGLAALEPAAAYEKLLALKGVGPWTAHYAGMRALGHRDSLPAADVGLQKAIMRFYGLRKMPSAARVERIAKPWAGWRSYATFYLWLTFWEPADWRNQLEGELRAARRGRNK